MNCKSLMYVAALLSWICVSCGNSNNSEETTIHSVVITEPERMESSVSKNYSGVVAESKSISLGFKTAGQILNTYVKEGDYVNAGQLIASLDDVDYQLAAKEARIQYEQMLNENKRLQYLMETNNVSQNDFEKSSAGLERLKVNLENCLNRIKYTKLYAPVSGYVTKLNFQKAEMVNAGTPIIELMDNSALEVNVDLPLEAYTKRDLFKNFVAKTVNGDEFKLTLINITPKADNNQLYNMRLSIPSSYNKVLTPGMNVNVMIVRNDGVVEETAEDFILPIHSIFYDNKGNAHVWALAKDSTVNALDITVGDVVANGKVRITSGLSGNETIVRAGVNSLQQGEKVKIVAEPQTTNVGSLL